MTVDAKNQLVKAIDKVLATFQEDVYAQRQGPSCRIIERPDGLELAGTDVEVLTRIYNKLTQEKPDIYGTRLNPVTRDELLTQLTPEELDVLHGFKLLTPKKGKPNPKPDKDA